MTQRMTAAELIAQARGARQGRVRNARRTKIGELSFDSELEATWWTRLCLRQRVGQIADLKRQVKIPLVGRDGPVLTPTGRPMTYVADFVWTEDGREVVADAKGFATETYLLKRAILAAQGISVMELN